MQKNYQLLAISLFLLAASSLHAQKLGIRAGVNLANMKINNNLPIAGADPSAKLGVHFEMIADFALNNNFSVESGIGISTKGYKVSVEETKPISGTTFTTTGRRTMNYLDIPVRLKMQTSNTQRKYFAAFGPQIGIGLTGKWHTEKILAEKSTIEGAQVPWNDHEDENSFNRVDIGYYAGVGAEMNTLIVELSFSGSLSNISSTKSIGNLAKNNVVSLSVGRYLLRRVRNVTDKELMRSSRFEVIRKSKYPKKKKKGRR